MTFQNLKLTNDVPFEETKSQLFNAAGCTVSAAMKYLLRPDSEVVAAMSGLDLFNNAQSMVNRIATDDMTLKKLRFILLKGYLSNFVNEKCLAAISSNSVVTVKDLRDAVLGCYETYGAVVDTTRIVAKYFAHKSDLDTQRKMGTSGFRPSCSTCGEGLDTGHQIDFITRRGEIKGTTKLQLALAASNKAIPVQIVRLKGTSRRKKFLQRKRFLPRILTGCLLQTQ